MHCATVVQIKNKRNAVASDIELPIKGKEHFGNSDYGYVGCPYRRAGS